MLRFFLVLLLLACKIFFILTILSLSFQGLFTPIIASSADDPVIPGEEEEEIPSDQDNPGNQDQDDPGDQDTPPNQGTPSDQDDPGDQDESNPCSGRCYPVADLSPQGYTCYPCADPNCALCTPKECLLCFDGFSESGENCLEDNFYECPAGCSACDSSKKCLQCDTNYFMNGDSCMMLCPQRKFPQNPTGSCDIPKCADCPSNCLKCTDSNTCTLCETGFDLVGDLVGAICVPSCSSGSYRLDALNCAACPSECTACSDTKICTACADSYIFDSKSATCNKPTTVAAIAAKSKTVTSAATQVTSLLSSGKSIAMSASICGKILTNIRYLNITYSTKLQAVFDTWTTSLISFGFDFDMPDSLESKIPARHVPYVFNKYDIPSSFLANFWDNICVLSVVLLIFLFLYGIEYIYGRSFSTEGSLKAIIKTCRIYIQNFFVTLLFGIYGDALLFSTIEYQSVKFEWNIALLSFATSIFFLLLTVLSFVFHLRLLFKYQSLKNNKSRTENLEKFMKDTKGTEVLYRDYQDSSIWSQAFLPFLILRDLGFSAILASLFHFPLVQVLLIFTLNVAMLLYLVICRPFKGRFDLIQQIFFEVAGLTVNVYVLVNSQLSDQYEDMLNVREQIGDGIILTNLLFNFITAGFMALKLIMLLKDLYSAYKLKNTQSHPPQRKKQALELSTNSPISHNTSISRLNNNSFNSQEDSLPIQDISSLDQLPLHKNPRNNLTFRKPQVVGPTSDFQIRFNSNSRSPVRSPNRSFVSTLEISQGSRQQEIIRNNAKPSRIQRKEELQKKIDPTHLRRKRNMSLQKKQKTNGGINLMMNLQMDLKKNSTFKGELITIK